MQNVLFDPSVIFLYSFNLQQQRSTVIKQVGTAVIMIGRKYQSKHKKIKHTKQIKHLMISTNLQEVSLEYDNIDSLNDNATVLELRHDI